MNTCLLSEETSSHTVQDLLVYRTEVLSDLANTLLAAQTSESPVASGLLVIRNELRSIAKDIGEMEPEERPLSEVLRRIHVAA